MIALLVTVLGGLLWWFGTMKIEQAGYVIFAIGVFYLVGAIQGAPSPRAFFTTKGV